jgi:hypothetical protein
LLASEEGLCSVDTFSYNENYTKHITAKCKVYNAAASGVYSNSSCLVWYFDADYSMNPIKQLFPPDQALKTAL